MANYQIVQCLDCGRDIERRGPRVRCAHCSNIKHNLLVREQNSKRDRSKIKRKFKKLKRGI